MPNIGAQKMCVSNEKCLKQTEPLKSETFKISYDVLVNFKCEWQDKTSPKLTPD